MHAYGHLLLSLAVRYSDDSEILLSQWTGFKFLVPALPREKL